MSRIFFWPADVGGCMWYRCLYPARALVAQGHTVRVAKELMTNNDGEVPVDAVDGVVYHADVVVGQRVVKPDVSRVWQELARKGNCKLVYEVDDDLFHTGPTNGQVHTFFSQPEIRANLIANVKVADLVTVSTKPLADVMREHNLNVVVIPNYVPSFMLDLPSPHAHGDPVVTVGWAGGPTHHRDWKEAASEVVRFINHYPNTEMHIMGVPMPGLRGRAKTDELPPSALLDKLPAARTRFTSWIDTPSNYYRAIDFDIGLAPLRPNTFNRSKSYVKALEYAALGIPCVASAVGPYPGFVRHGETGYLIRRAHEWTVYLRQLMDPTVREEMGAKARALAAEHTIENNVHLWEKALCG